MQRGFGAASNLFTLASFDMPAVREVRARQMRRGRTGQPHKGTGARGRGGDFRRRRDKIMSGGPRLRQEDHLSALHPGARLQSYTIASILGAGGFGITYKAVEDITSRDVAIKEYLPTAFAVRDRDGSTVRPLSEGAARDFQWGLERFREEAKLLIAFRHANIVPVLAYFEANGTGYLVMEFQDGTSLS
jgi:serine/threonine protein kinase